MRRTTLVWIALALGFLLVGCQTVDLEAPPEIQYGRDVCSRCGMIIDDPRFAAGYVTTDGKQRIFDDIGDMLLYHKLSGDAVHAWWVHDYDTEQWLRAETAVFVQSDALHSPMGHGLAAVSTAAQAQALALRFSGVVMTFDALGQDAAMRTPSGEHSGHAHP